jgi:pimeloyl-ACP methyl ester carboxylesterase
MKKLNCFLFIVSCCLLSFQSCKTKAQKGNQNISDGSFIYSAAQVETLMVKPTCMGEYLASQAGPLFKKNADGSLTYDSTFTVEKIKIPSEGLLITGWLYLPLGENKCPLVILTNGGGDGSRGAKSFSDFMAPVLAHCGIAAFVHDKRGTGESEGEYVNTTYNDYITDAGNCAIFLSGHKRIKPDLIGVMGASEGGRIAVIAASRYPVIKFVVSQAGTVVTTVEDRLYAQLNGMIDGGLMNDSICSLVRPLWEKSFKAWESNDPAEHEKVNKEILEWRQKYDRRFLPFTNHEMDSIPYFRYVLPTWKSMPNDYLTELGHFNKKWLAIFGEVDRVVPTDASIKNIKYYMSKSGNKDYNIAVLHNCGHSPVDVDTKLMVNFHYLIINWLKEKCIQ